MIAPERLAALRFEAEHKGISVHRHAAMVKAGTPMPEHGRMIPLTPSELRQLLDAYEAALELAAGAIVGVGSVPAAGTEPCAAPTPGPSTGPSTNPPGSVPGMSATGSRNFPPDQ
jgi:hypothetical protein